MRDVFGWTAVVKGVDVRNTYQVVTSYQIDNTNEDAADVVMSALYEGIKGIQAGDISLDALSVYLPFQYFMFYAAYKRFRSSDLY